MLSVSSFPNPHNRFNTYLQVKALSLHRKESKNENRSISLHRIRALAAHGILIHTPAQAQGRQLHINKAIYGKNGQGIDVTNNLRSQIQNNTLNVKVNNKNMGADPNVGRTSP